MARRPATFWQRNKFKINGLVLLLPIWYFYQSLYPVFPDAWEAQSIGPYQVTLMPLNMDPPYTHHDAHVKDFMLTFSQGDVASIRQGYLNIGEQPLSLSELQQGDEGIMHGSRHAQHVHGIAPAQFSSEHKVWLTVQTWSGDQYVQSWELPRELVSQ